ncbi:MAG: cbb3-type cytochrome c oxidase N-terminal domain-containing protein [Ignavibacteria bacterium]|jgi:cytochrome c oxidase cbb3-type subunit 3
MKIKFKYFYTLLFLVSTSGFTQTPEKTGMQTETYAYLFLAGLLCTLAILFASFMIFETLERKAKKAKIKVIQNSDALLLREHNYDGIFELDNKAPAWFQFLFYVTILFSVIYMLNFHVLKKNNLQIDEYNQEMIAAQQEKDLLLKNGGLINETNVTSLTSTEDLKAGKDLFTVNCVSCHGNLGEGTVGPNLTDDYWIHGGGIKNVFATISNGVPAKGMISWKAQLNPKQIQQAASYVLSLHGTNPPNGKPPEGLIYKEEAVTKDSTKVVKTDSLKNK